MPETAVRIDNLVKCFRKTAPPAGEKADGKPRLPRLRVRTSHTLKRVLNEVSLDVYRNEVLGVLGPNGSGKSTLIRIISTLLLPDDGSVTVFGHDVTREPMAVQRLLNRVSADAAFFRKLSAMENLIHTARLYGLPADQSRVRISHILGRLDLGRDKLDAEMHELSRGMQQKVALARAFLTSPVLLLLDEPTTGLDLKSRKEVQNFVQEIKRDHDATILLTTHDMIEAEALCDRIAIIDDGRIVALGTSGELKALAQKRSGSEKTPTLEEAFVALTGRSMEAAEAESQNQ